MIEELMPNVYWPEIWEASLDTLLMLGGSMLFTVILGLPLGVLLFLSGQSERPAQRTLYGAVSQLVNSVRSLTGAPLSFDATP